MTILPPGAALAACLLFTMPASAEQLGRLFFTPEQRAALERERFLNIRGKESRGIGDATLSVTGIVQRSSGRRTAWINGTPRHDDAAVSAVRVETAKDDPGRTTIVAGDEPPVQLKVGETINRSTRETTSGVGDGSIVVPPAAPASRRRN